MTALSEALLTAQRGALAAMQKAYLRGQLEAEEVERRMLAVGLTDSSDSTLYLAALEVMKELGADGLNGAAAKPPAEDEPASEAQWKLIRRLADERGQVAPDGPLTKAQASAAITELKAGTYSADRYTVPF